MAILSDLLLLLQELAIEQGDLLPVGVREAPQRRLVRLVQLRQEVTLLKMEKRNVVENSFATSCSHFLLGSCC